MLTILTPAQLALEAQEIWPKLAPLLERWKKAELTDGQVVTLYVLTYMSHRLGRCWGGPRKKGKGLPRPPHTFHIAQLEDLPFFLDHFHLTHLSPRINDSMANFLRGTWPFHLITHVPDALEVLQYQCQGQRPITMITGPALLANYVHEKKDAVNFMLHDLAHGERFFHGGPKEAQIGLFRCLLHAWQSGVFYRESLLDPIFREKLEYGMADMNSHPLHLLQYLKAIWLEHYIRIGASEAEMLAAQEEFLEKMFWPVQVKNNIRQVNTPALGREEAQFLETYFAQLGSNP